MILPLQSPHWAPVPFSLRIEMKSQLAESCLPWAMQKMEAPLLPGSHLGEIQTWKKPLLKSRIQLRILERKACLAIYSVLKGHCPHVPTVSVLSPHDQTQERERSCRPLGKCLKKRIFCGYCVLKSRVSLPVNYKVIFFKSDRLTYRKGRILSWETHLEKSYAEKLPVLGSAWEPVNGTFTIHLEKVWAGKDWGRAWNRSQMAPTPVGSRWDR